MTNKAMLLEHHRRIFIAKLSMLVIRSRSIIMETDLFLNMLLSLP